MPACFNTNRNPNTLAAEHPLVGFGTVLWFGALLWSGGNRRECGRAQDMMTSEVSVDTIVILSLAQLLRTA
jgi:hypothetical protein